MFENEYCEAYDLLKNAVFKTVNDIVNNKESIHTAIINLYARTVKIDNALIAEIKAALDDLDRCDGYSNDDQ